MTEAILLNGVLTALGFKRIPIEILNCFISCNFYFWWKVLNSTISFNFSLTFSDFLNYSKTKNFSEFFKPMIDIRSCFICGSNKEKFPKNFRTVDFAAALWWHLRGLIIAKNFEKQRKLSKCQLWHASLISYEVFETIATKQIMTPIIATKS